MFYVPGTVLGSEDIVWITSLDNVSTFMDIILLWVE